MGRFEDQMQYDIERTLMNNREGATEIRYNAQNIWARVRIPTEVEIVTGVIAWDAEITVSRKQALTHTEGTPVQIDGVWYRTTRVLVEGAGTRTIGLLRSA